MDAIDETFFVEVDQQPKPKIQRFQTRERLEVEYPRGTKHRGTARPSAATKILDALVGI